MTKSPSKLMAQIATKYSKGAPDYDEVLDDLRELKLLVELNTCLDIRAHRVYVDPQISSLQIILEGGVKKK